MQSKNTRSTLYRFVVLLGLRMMEGFHPVLTSLANFEQQFSIWLSYESRLAELFPAVVLLLADNNIGSYSLALKLLFLDMLL